MGLVCPVPQHAGHHCAAVLPEQDLAGSGAPFWPRRACRYKR